MIILNVACSSGPFKPLMKKKPYTSLSSKMLFIYLRAATVKLPILLSLELLSQYQELY